MRVMFYTQVKIERLVLWCEKLVSIDFKHNFTQCFVEHSKVVRYLYCPVIFVIFKIISLHTFTFTFTFMHLADAFIQSDLQCIRVTVSTFYQLLLSLGIEPMILALLAPCSTSWATGKRMNVKIWMWNTKMNVKTENILKIIENINTNYNCI